MQCKYKTSELSVAYPCNRNAVARDYCEFHDENYWKDHTDEVRAKFYELVKDAITKKESLEVIGFHLPSIDLRGKKFEAPVIFFTTHFHQDAEFSDTHFHCDARFRQAHFHCDARFRQAHFHQNADFWQAHFHQNADFWQAHFNPYAHFSRAHFHQNASFLGAHFHQVAEFSRAHFDQDAEFLKAHFDQDAHFFAAHFQDADFVGAYFDRDADFADAHFHQVAEFSRAHFDQNASFLGAHFHQNATFTSTVFIVPVDRCTSDLKLSNLNYISFRNTRFEKPDIIIFDHTYLGRVSFIGANIDRVRFKNVIWREKGRSLGIDKRYLIFDEELLMLKAEKKASKEVLTNYEDEKGSGESERLIESRAGDEDATLTNVVSVYTMLRENYEYYLRYSEAGRFFVSEMDIKRLVREVGKKISSAEEGEPKRELDWDPGHAKGEMSSFRIEIGYKRNDWFRRNLSLIGFYRHIALYGESVYRQMFIITPLLIAFFWVLRVLFGICSSEQCNVMEQLVDSAAAYFQLPRSGHMNSIDVIERIASIPVLGTLFIALRRKFERRIRH